MIPSPPPRDNTKKKQKKITELESGRANPDSNPVLYLRCAELMHNLERAVVFGSPRCGDFEKLYAAGRLTKEELQELELADRRFAAAQLSGGDEDVTVIEGVLGYKRWTRSNPMQRKKWQDRLFKIKYRTLLCYRLSDNKLKRAIPLHHTTVVVVKHHDHQFYFELQEKKRDRVYKLYAQDQATMDKWVRTLKSQAAAPPVSEPALMDTDKLTDAQIARYGFFRSEREFVRNLTDICEELRFVEVKDRKPALRTRLDALDVPGCVYLPLCRSTDTWRRVVRVLPEKGHPFSTKARCPCLMTFEVSTDGPFATDVANFLYQTLGLGALEILDDEDEGAAGSSSADPASEAWKSRFASSARASVRKVNVKVVLEEGPEDSVRVLHGDSVASQPAEEGEIKVRLSDSPAVGLDRKLPTDSAVEGAARAVSRIRTLTGDGDSAGGNATGQSASAGAGAGRMVPLANPLTPNSKSHSLWDESATTTPLTTKDGGSAGKMIQRKPSSDRKREKREHATQRAHALIKKTLSGGGAFASGEKRLSTDMRQPLLGGGSGGEEKQEANPADTAEQPVASAGGNRKHTPSERIQSMSRLATIRTEPAFTKIIAKSNDDLRQEVFTMQLLQFLKDVWTAAKLPLFIYTYRILSTSKDTGLLEVIDNADSFDGVKKDLQGARFIEWYRNAFPEKADYDAAARRYAESIAGYSIATYLLGIHDRHNGNIVCWVFLHPCM